MNIDLEKRKDHARGMIEWIKQRAYLFLSNSDYEKALEGWKKELEELERAN